MNFTDFKPRLFTFSQEKNFFQSFLPFYRLEAEDRDFGTNGEVHYRFSSINNSLLHIFHLDNRTGILTVLTSLDREIIGLYELDVQAFDVDNKTADGEFIQACINFFFS